MTLPKLSGAITCIRSARLCLDPMSEDEATAARVHVRVPPPQAPLLFLLGDQCPPVASFQSRLT